MHNRKISFLFDLDGVLADTTEIQVESTIESLIKYQKFPLTEGHHRILEETITTKEKLLILCKGGAIERKDIEEIYLMKKQITDRKLKSFLVDKEKQKIFEYLRKNGHKYAVVTNANRPSSIILLTALGLWDYVDVLISNEDVVNPKPHAEPYISAMLALGGALEDFIVIEDSPVGALAAKRAGLEVYMVEDSRETTLSFIEEIIRSKQDGD